MENKRLSQKSVFYFTAMFAKKSQRTQNANNKKFTFVHIA